MNLEKNDDKLDKKEDDTMSAIVNASRPCSIRESIIQSCKEVKAMREGKKPLRSLEDLFSDIEKWKEEEQKGE